MIVSGIQLPQGREPSGAGDSRQLATRAWPAPWPLPPSLPWGPVRACRWCNSPMYTSPLERRSCPFPCRRLLRNSPVYTSPLGILIRPRLNTSTSPSAVTSVRQPESEPSAMISGSGASIPGPHPPAPPRVVPADKSCCCAQGWCRARPFARFGRGRYSASRGRAGVPSKLATTARSCGLPEGAHRNTWLAVRAAARLPTSGIRRPQAAPTPSPPLAPVWRALAAGRCRRRATHLPVCLAPRRPEPEASPRSTRLRCSWATRRRASRCRAPPE